jgi:hypothetical protein
MTMGVRTRYIRAISFRIVFASILSRNLVSAEAGNFEMVCS